MIETLRDGSGVSVLRQIETQLRRTWIANLWLPGQRIWRLCPKAKPHIYVRHAAERSKETK